MARNNQQDTAPDVHPGDAQRQRAATDETGPVQPIETVRNKPEANNEEAESIIVSNKPNLQRDGEETKTIDEEETKKQDEPEAELCWNCANHNKSNPLDSNGNCNNCGFEKDKLYNGAIEAEKANQRQLAQIQQ